jgi:hypothetical protein
MDASLYITRDEIYDLVMKMLVLNDPDGVVNIQGTVIEAVHEEPASVERAHRWAEELIRSREYDEEGDEDGFFDRHSEVFNVDDGTPVEERDEEADRRIARLLVEQLTRRFNL